MGQGPQTRRSRDPRVGRYGEQLVSTATPDPIEVGVVVGAHGIAGALRVRLHDAQSEALANARPVVLRLKDGESQSCTVHRLARQPGTPTIRLWVDAIRSRDDAERWRGAAVLVDREQLVLGDDEYYLADLVGLRVRGHADSSVGAGRDLGQVDDVTSNGVQDLLQIETVTPDGRIQWLLPALPEFVVSFDEEEIVVDVPPGFAPDLFEPDSR
ncbi:MAG: 16S rRNA processing protein RimM [Myxococcales bacterium FL481]|nr:MAG: 16S rRNA processing protein RimM [Myxococcales bacterium FL481]